MNSCFQEYETKRLLQNKYNIGGVKMDKENDKLEKKILEMIETLIDKYDELDAMEKELKSKNGQH